jgi:hypothetical protein
MKPHEYKLVAERLLDVLRSGPKPKQRTVAPPAFNIAGRWDVDVKYQVGEARHMLFLETDGNKVTGTHIATRWRGEVKGTIDGDKVSLHSSIPFEGANLGFVFKGTVSAAGMTGELEPDEYPRAAWDARRHRTA